MKKKNHFKFVLQLSLIAHIAKMWLAEITYFDTVVLGFTTLEPANHSQDLIFLGLW